MSWMLRLLERLVARPRASESAASKWVEPSNAITRAIISGALLQPALAAPARTAAIAAAPTAVPALPQPEVAAIVAEPEAVEAPERAAATVTRTAQRSRRRRASRAA